MRLWIPVLNKSVRSILILCGIYTMGRLPMNSLHHWKLHVAGGLWTPTPVLSCPRVFPDSLARRIARGEKAYLVECQVAYHRSELEQHVGPRFLVRRGDKKGMRDALVWSLESKSLLRHVEGDAMSLAYFLALAFANETAPPVQDQSRAR